MIIEYFANLPMNFAKGIFNFFYFWYIQSSKNFWRREIGFMKGVERDIGVFINLRLLFQPIYGDYSYMGRVIGPILRFGRVLLGFIIMAISTIAVLTIYLIWLILPPLAILMMVLNLMEV